MKKQFIFFSLLFGVLSCTQPKYLVKPENEILGIASEQNALKYIPLSDTDLDSSRILRKTCQFLSSKKLSGLKKYLSANEEQTPDYYLAETLYHISKNDYQGAFFSLQKVDENHYTLLRQLLFIDLNYELAKINGVADYKRFLQDYQNLIDKYPDNEPLEEIVSTRVRYVRYNY